jgi:hypothetical protein
MWWPQKQTTDNTMTTRKRTDDALISVVRVTRSLVVCVCFVDRCFSFCPVSIGHCVFCSSNYGFWISLGIFKLFF